MKKRIFAGICCLMVLLTLASCARERHDLLYSVEVGELTYCVRGTDTRAKQVVVKRGDAIVCLGSLYTYCEIIPEIEKLDIAKRR